jgi:hypothetical protein
MFYLSLHGVTVIQEGRTTMTNRDTQFVVVIDRPRSDCLDVSSSHETFDEAGTAASKLLLGVEPDTVEVSIFERRAVAVVNVVLKEVE